MVGNLSPTRSSYKSILQKPNKTRHVSTKLEMMVSPTTYINDFIINNLADNDVTGLFGKPDDLYEGEYEDLRLFREKFFFDSLSLKNFLRLKTFENFA